MKSEIVKKINMWAFIIIISSVLLFLSIHTFFGQKESSSWYENRTLAPMPQLSLSAVRDGRYFEDIENYQKDHFYKRDSWLDFFTSIHLKALKKHIVNDVVVTEDLLLPQLKPSLPSLGYQDLGDRIANDLTRLNEVVESIGAKFIYIGVPEQYSMLRDRYPHPLFNNGVNLTTVESVFFSSIDKANITSINMRPIYADEADKTYLYSKIDHHYRIEGAYLAYFTLCEKLHEIGFDFPILTKEDFEYGELPNPFYGSRSRKLYSVSPVDEKLKIFNLKNPIPFKRFDNEEEVEATVFKLPQDKRKPIDYTVYMGGDIGETIIETNRPELPNILLFGDSFTNAMECFLYTSFNETRSLDLRHYNEMGILQYIQENKPDIVVCMRSDITYLLQDGNGIIE